MLTSGVLMHAGQQVSMTMQAHDTSSSPCSEAIKLAEMVWQRPPLALLWPHSRAVLVLLRDPNNAHVALTGQHLG